MNGHIIIRHQHFSILSFLLLVIAYNKNFEYVQFLIIIYHMINIEISKITHNSLKIDLQIDFLK